MTIKRLVATVFLLPSLATAEIIDEMALETSGMGGADRPMVSSNLNMIQKAFDKSGPRDNTVHFKYSPDATYKLRLREFMNTTIVLPKGEQIKSFSLGEETNFTFVPLSNDDEELTNLAQVFPEYPGADTNLTIVGRTGRVYSFYLRSDSVRSPHLPHLVAYVNDLDFVASHETPVQPEKQFEADPEYLRELGLVNPDELEMDYVFINGDMTLAPIRVFSDGYMTYFQFGKENLDRVQRLPTIYRVVDGYDSPANTRVVGGTLVADTISDKWTLRNGESHLCVRKE